MNTFFLLADDDRDDAELFNEALSTVNPSIKFHHVEDGHEVFQFLLNSKIEKPDVIFLDLNMPAMSGWQCLAKLKNDTALKKIPDSDSMVQVALRKNPSKRLTTPEDVASSLVALAQPCTYWLNGNVLYIDGGEGHTG